MYWCLTNWVSFVCIYSLYFFFHNACRNFQYIYARLQIILINAKTLTIKMTLHILPKSKKISVISQQQPAIPLRLQREQKYCQILCFLITNFLKHHVVNKEWLVLKILLPLSKPIVFERHTKRYKKLNKLTW